MNEQRPFRFGVIVSQTCSKDEWIARARKAERLGYSTVLIPDHFGDQFSPVPALVAAAQATTSLRIGSFVFDNDFRHPALLAKEAATLDVLSGGRFELGIGAGWLQAEYEQAGIPYQPGRIRTNKLDEALHVIKGLLAEGPVTFAGNYYTITGLSVVCGQGKSVVE
jgi:probable F420-dependent oxidoreductase